MRLAVHGAAGRMGRRIISLALADARFDVALALDRAGSSGVIAGDGASARSVAISHDPGAIVLGSIDVVIDFSSEEGAARALAIAERAGAALLVGTTGLSASMKATLASASSSRAVLLAPNTSLGVAVLALLTKKCAEALNGFDASIVEAHHNQKKDAPSGTALRLADAARAGGAALSAENVVAIRGGDVIGEHTVRFAGAGEYIELTHRATSRDLFARGALRAAAWLAGAGPGWWSMEDVLGLRA